MRLAIDCRMWFSGGIGTYLRNLVPHLIAAFSKHEIFLLGNMDDLSEINFDSKGQVQISQWNSPIYSISEQFDLPQSLSKADVLISPQYNIPLLFRGTQITTIHDIFHLAKENQQSTFSKKIYARSMLSMAMRKSEIIFTDSEFTLNEMEKYKLPRLDKVKVVHLGYNFEKKKLNINDKDKSCQQLLYVGNIKPHKNLKRLVEAYKLLRERHNVTIPLMIVGEMENFITGIPNFKKELNQSSLRKFVRFTGRISDGELMKIYSEATILVQPSLYEGFGLPPLEAMSSGCPVVSSHAGSLPEVCGDGALYFDPYDIEDMADKINQVIVDDELRKNLINKGYCRVKQFSWGRTAKEKVRLIKQVCKI